MADKMLEAALAYAKRGWAVFPVRASKKPYTQHAVLDATTDPNIIRAMWQRHPNANIALNVGAADMMVLDYDPGHSLEELEQNAGPIPATRLQAITPRGGRHLYFALDVGEIVSSSASRIADHIDVRSFHGYVLLPPSKTKDGVYAWEDEGEPSFRTDEMVRVANSAREKHDDRDRWIIEPDLPENIASCIKWLRGETEPKRQVAIEGQGGDQCAYNTAAMCKSYGISEALAFDLMWEHWNPDCVPPWSTDEVDHFQQKIENGYEYNTSPPGNMTPAYHTAHSSELFKKVEHEEASGLWTSGRFRMVDRHGLDQIQDPTWLVEDFLTSEGYAIMFGAHSSYKTFIALDLALTIAAYDSTLKPNWTCPEPGAVCFVAGEGRSQLLKRVQAWELVHHKGVKAPNFFLADPLPRVMDDPDLFLSVLSQAPIDHFRLIVLDTIGRAMQGVNENAQEYASKFTALVERIQREFNTAVLALHHTGKQDRLRSRGSSVFAADVDTEVLIEADNTLCTLTMTKQKDAAEWEHPKLFKLQEIQLDLTRKSLAVVAFVKGDLEHEKISEQALFLQVVEREAIGWLVAHGGKATTRELAIGIAGPCGRAAKTLMNTQLVILRENKDSRIFSCYDTHTGCWRRRDDMVH